MNKRFLFKFLLIMVFICRTKCKRYPVILLSGYMGNQLNVKLHDADAPLGCSRNSFLRTNVWLDAVSAYLFPECWQHKLALHYDRNLHRSFSNKGVDVKTNQFGSLIGLDYISTFPQQNRISEYYALLIRSLESHAGYRRNRDIFGAPYDWRKSPHEQSEFFENLRQLVERAYFFNNETPVILLGHSMGGNFIYIFLRNQSPEWKKKFIRTTFFMAVPWGGNFKYLYSYLYNDDFAGNILPMFRDIERNFPSLSFLLPNRRVFGNDVLLETPNNKYTPLNLDKLMIRLGRSDVIPMWEDTRELMDPFVHPGTDIICVVGIGFNTMRKLILTKDALIDHKYPIALRRKRRSSNSRGFSVRSQRNQAVLNKNVELRSKQINSHFELTFNKTSGYNVVFSLDGKPRSKKVTECIINQIRDKFNSMFDGLLNIGHKLSGFMPINFPYMQRLRDNLFNSRRFEYYWHALESILNLALPEYAYDEKQGRYIFFSEGDSFVNIESGLKCLDWYSDSSKSKHKFFFDLINDSHLGMLRNKNSVLYYTKLIMAID